MNTYNVQKAKMIDRLFLEVELEEVITTKEGDEENTYTDELVKKCKRPVHPDLIAAFDALTPHLPVLCELSDHRLLPVDDAELSSYAVTGFSIGGRDEHEGVTLVGRKKLTNKRILNLVAPFTKWEDEHNQYLHATRLKDAIANCEYEVLQYLYHGKIAPQAQTELELAS